MAIIRKSTQEIEQMERAGRVVVQTLELVGEHVRAGVTTQELDELAEEFIRSQGGVPTFKGYRGYPASICTSPNDMVVHGIPGPSATPPTPFPSVRSTRRLAASSTPARRR
jgi:methionyl aminopeptidase